MTCSVASRRRSSGLALALALGAAMPAAGPVSAAEVTIERAFGHVIGDIVVADTRLELPPGARLVDTSLPRPGRVSPWLNLLDVSVDDDGDARRLRRRFQLTASAETVKLLYLPPAEVRYRIGDRESAERLPAVPVTVSPLSNRLPVTRSGLGDLRPDRAAPLPPLARIDGWLRIALGVLAATVALSLALRWQARRVVGFAPFRAAARTLRRRNRDGAARLDTGYRALHRAFDVCAGRTVFAGNLDEFLRDHPRFASQREAIADFFGRSTGRFFAGAGHDAGGDADADLRRLQRLADGLARLDRGTIA